MEEPSSSAGHPTAARCYAWEVDGESTAVLGEPPIDSALLAVRASIAAWEMKRPGYCARRAGGSQLGRPLSGQGSFKVQSELRGQSITCPLAAVFCLMRSSRCVISWRRAQVSSLGMSVLTRALAIQRTS